VFHIFGTRIDVRTADPLSVEADGLVIPANDHLWMGTGLGGTVKKRGGEAIEIAAVRQGPAELGQAIATEAGELGFRRLYHAVVAGQDLKPHHDRIGPALRAALAAASKDGLQRVAVAPLEDETLIGAFHVAAGEVVRALLDVLGGATKLQEIILVTHGEEGRSAYRQALHEGLSGK
jgi:O-acetyl-ADP-ribose deacetylase (regulator of RNase III)